MGPPTPRSRRLLLCLPVLVLLGSLTVLFGAGGVVTVTSPAHRAKVSGTIDVQAQVPDPESVAYAVLVVDGQRPASRNAAPWTFSWDTREYADGPHALSVETYDRQELTAVSKAITVTVKNRTAPPAPARPARPVKSTLARAPRALAAVTAKQAALVKVAPGPAPEPKSATSLPTPTPRPAGSVAAAAPAAAAPTPAPRPTLAVVMNGQPLEAEVAPMLVKGRIHLGLRALFAGARVEWLAEQRTARCVTNGLTVEVPIGSRIARVNGQAVDMGAVATLKDGRTVIPLQFFAQVTGARLAWDARTGLASVQTSGHALAGVSASLPPAANLPAPAPADRRTPLSEVADRAP